MRAKPLFVQKMSLSGRAGGVFRFRTCTHCVVFCGFAFRFRISSQFSDCVCDSLLDSVCFAVQRADSSSASQSSGLAFCMRNFVLAEWEVICVLVTHLRTIL